MAEKKVSPLFVNKTTKRLNEYIKTIVQHLRVLKMLLQVKYMMK